MTSPAHKHVELGRRLRDIRTYLGETQTYVLERLLEYAIKAYGREKRPKARKKRGG